MPHLLGHFDNSILKKGIYLFRFFFFFKFFWGRGDFRNQFICNSWFFQFFDQSKFKCLKVEDTSPSQLPHTSFLASLLPALYGLCKHLRSFFCLYFFLPSLTPSRKDTVRLSSPITGPISMLALCQPAYSIHNIGLESPRIQILPSPWGAVCVHDGPLALAI